jgi:hypothetical protein
MKASGGPGPDWPVVLRVFGAGRSTPGRRRGRQWLRDVGRIEAPAERFLAMVRRIEAEVEAVNRRRAVRLRFPRNRHAGDRDAGMRRRPMAGEGPDLLRMG